MPSRNLPPTIYCRDARKALEAQRQLLDSIETSLRCPVCGADLTGDAAPEVDAGSTKTLLEPRIDPVVDGVGCTAALHALGASVVSLRKVLEAMRVLTEIPLQALAAFPDDHAFAPPAGTGAPGTGRPPRARKAST